VSRPHLHRHRCAAVDVFRKKTIVAGRPVCLQLSRRSAENYNVYAYTVHNVAHSTVFDCKGCTADNAEVVRERALAASSSLRALNGVVCSTPVSRRQRRRRRRRGGGGSGGRVAMGGHQQACADWLAIRRRIAVHHFGAASSPAAAAAAAAARPGDKALFIAALASRLEASIDAHARHLYPAGCHRTCLSALPTPCPLLQILSCYLIDHHHSRLLIGPVAQRTVPQLGSVFLAYGRTNE